MVYTLLLPIYSYTRGEIIIILFNMAIIIIFIYFYQLNTLLQSFLAVKNIDHITARFSITSQHRILAICPLVNHFYFRYLKLIIPAMPAQNQVLNESYNRIQLDLQIQH